MEVLSLLHDMSDSQGERVSPPKRPLRILMACSQWSSVSFRLYVQHPLRTVSCSRAAQDAPNCEAELAFQRRLAH